MLIGKVKPPGIREAAGLLWSLPLRQSRLASSLFWSSIFRKDVWVDLNRGTRAVCFSPPGGGKTSRFSINYALTVPGSSALCVFDPKGEIFVNSYEHRKQFGECNVVDPMRCVVENPATYNPLDLISSDDPHALDLAMSFASAMVQTTGMEHDPHWNAKAVSFITAQIALAVAGYVDADRNLQTVIGVLANDASRAVAQERMKNSKAWGDLLARLGHQASQPVGKELSSILSVCERNFQAFSTPAVVESTTKSSFDLRKMVEPGNTTYFVLPPQYLESHAGLLRLWMTSFLRLVASTGLKPEGSIHLIAEEAASFGSNLTVVENAISQLRGYGLNMAFCYQSISQLEKAYPNSQHKAFLAQMDTQLFMGIRDYETAEYVSKMLGEASISISNASGGSNVGSGNDNQGHANWSAGSNIGWIEQKLGRSLLKPEEIMNLPRNQAVVFPPAGVRAFLVRLVPFYSVEFRERKHRHWLGWSLWLAVVSVCLAIGVARWLDDSPKSPGVEPRKWRPFNEVRYGKAR